VVGGGLLPRSYSFPKLLLYPVTALALERYIAEPSPRRLAMLAAWTVFAFLIRYDHGLFIGAGCGAAVLLTHWSNVRATLPHLVRYATLVLMLLAPYLLYLQWTAGVFSHAREAIDFSRAEARHAPVVFPTFAIDARTAVTAERPTATIHVRWSEPLRQETRAAIEQELGLATDGHLGDETWRYRVTDLSSAAIERIVQHPLVEDTHGIDRATYAIDLERREWCVVCFAAGPGLHARENAEAWLYYLAGLVVAAGVGAGVTRTAQPVPLVCALTVRWPSDLPTYGDSFRSCLMTALTSSTFLRTIPAAWMATRWRLLLRGATLAVLTITAAAVAVVGNAAEELAVARVFEGAAAVGGRLTTVTGALATPGPRVRCGPGPTINLSSATSRRVRGRRIASSCSVSPRTSTT
jgi:hypothetical protein